MGVDMPNIPEDKGGGPFNYAEKHGCLEILTGCVWEMNRLETRSACSLISCYS